MLQNRTQTGPLKEQMFSDLQLREIRFAGMLHDIGKISVKEEVLGKEKKLYRHELEVIRMRLKLMRANLKLHEHATGETHPEQIEKLFPRTIAIDVDRRPRQLHL